MIHDPNPVRDRLIEWILTSGKPRIFAQAWERLLTVDTLPSLEQLGHPKVAFDLEDKIRQLEATAIKEAMFCADGNVAHAANNLGLKRTTLGAKIKSLRKRGFEI
jgi:transcriptional regulator with PAS, ATPase and Fis domain